MQANRELHYCKGCNSNFLVKIDPELTGDYILVCPACQRQHYRYFKAGTAIHCDISKRKGEVKILN